MWAGICLDALVEGFDASITRGSAAYVERAVPFCGIQSGMPDI